MEKAEKNLEKKNVREEEIKIEIKNNERKKEKEKIQKILEINKEKREFILSDENKIGEIICKHCKNI